MAIDLTEKVLKYTDEIFTAESKRTLLTNDDFSWNGAHTVKVYKITTAKMNDYARNPAAGFAGSRYGEVGDLDAEFEEFTLSKDRSFTFAIDKLDEDETLGQLAGASALARQQREVVIPEVDTYTYKVMCDNAGNKPAAIEITPLNIMNALMEASRVLDNANVPETNRVLVVSPDVYAVLKKAPDIIMETTIGNEMRLLGVVSIVDGLTVVKVPANRLPENFGFMIAHPCATVAPAKLEEYKIHLDPPGISGSLVEGRIAYDAFVLDNKKDAIYYQEATKVNYGSLVVDSTKGLL